MDQNVGPGLVGCRHLVLCLSGIGIRLLLTFLCIGHSRLFSGHTRRGPIYKHKYNPRQPIHERARFRNAQVPSQMVAPASDLLNKRRCKYPLSAGADWPAARRAHSYPYIRRVRLVVPPLTDIWECGASGQPRTNTFSRLQWLSQDKLRL